MVSNFLQIPYVLSDDLNQNDRLTIAKAMEQIESDTCVKFVARGLSPYYVHIGRECSCGSNRCAFNGAYANIGPGPLPGEKEDRREEKEKKIIL